MKFQGFLCDLGEKFFSTDREILVCKQCQVKLNADKHFIVIQLNTEAVWSEMLKMSADRSNFHSAIVLHDLVWDDSFLYHPIGEAEVSILQTSWKSHNTHSSRWINIEKTVFISVTRRCSTKYELVLLTTNVDRGYVANIVVLIIGRPGEIFLLICEDLKILTIAISFVEICKATVVG